MFTVDWAIVKHFQQRNNGLLRLEEYGRFGPIETGDSLFKSNGFGLEPIGKEDIFQIESLIQ